MGKVSFPVRSGSPGPYWQESGWAAELEFGHEITLTCAILWPLRDLADFLDPVPTSRLDSKPSRSDPLHQVRTGFPGWDRLLGPQPIRLLPAIETKAPGHGVNIRSAGMKTPEGPRLAIASSAGIGEVAFDQLGQAEALVQLAGQQQSSVRGHRRAPELDAKLRVEREPDRARLRVTHRAVPSAPARNP